MREEGFEVGESGTYSKYVHELGLLASDVARGSWNKVEQDVSNAINGGAAASLRNLVPLETRRSQGAFFTSGPLRAAVVEALEVSADSRQRYWDPTCGAGDLLIAAAAYLPVRDGMTETLRAWSTSLRGNDLETEYVEAARLRLFLAAGYRSWRAGRSTSTEMRPDSCFRGITTRDGLEALEATRSFHGSILLNPPYGAVTDERFRSIGGGAVTLAAPFALAAATALRVGSQLCALLPDVLRSGSRYERWRNAFSSLAVPDKLQIGDQFDEHTDIHTFLISATRRRIQGPQGQTDWWPRSTAGQSVSSHFEVRVGSVVDNRDPCDGPAAPFLTARSMPASGEVGVPARTRRFAGKLLAPPFVALRRTSRPGPGKGGESRGVGVLVTGPTPIAVDNHIITARPLDGREETCRQLLKVLAAPPTSQWLDQRIRCRHLTVRAVRELPWSLQ